MMVVSYLLLWTLQEESLKTHSSSFKRCSQERINMAISEIGLQKLIVFYTKRDSWTEYPKCSALKE
jgi:hypothetical protein